ncbi:NAD-dependent epimerase/dehydratase family protein [Bradyrhizobium mercantei]|uniref:NAD-dependent epimerase/dehydratase family protein n=1 Tax=Bradyrhizobium mercantei TaxID=1904807 RepID=UPI0011777C77|nr:NAD-dependent epimerase/dehydratase family protein [Bradyrhizobium mercantei]
MMVLLTGATGFNGRHVVTRFLREGHSIVAIARNAGSRFKDVVAPKELLRRPWLGRGFQTSDRGEHDDRAPSHLAQLKVDRMVFTFNDPAPSIRRPEPEIMFRQGLRPDQLADREL